MAVLYDALCPLHSDPLVSTPEKPMIFAKCIRGFCNYGILRDDPQQAIQDIGQWNYTLTGEPSETLD